MRGRINVAGVERQSPPAGALTNRQMTGTPDTPVLRSKSGDSWTSRMPKEKVGVEGRSSWVKDKQRAKPQRSTLSRGNGQK